MIPRLTEEYGLLYFDAKIEGYNKDAGVADDIEVQVTRSPDAPASRYLTYLRVAEINLWLTPAQADALTTALIAARLDAKPNDP